MDQKFLGGAFLFYMLSTKATFTERGESLGGPKITYCCLMGWSEGLCQPGTANSSVPTSPVLVPRDKKQKLHGLLFVVLEQWFLLHSVSQEWS